MSFVELQKPILDGGVRSVNFFNGRLLSGEDLTQERAANRIVDWRLGRAIGAGIAYGLEVTEATGVSTKAAPVVAVAAGLAINGQGQTLALPQQTNVTLVRADSPLPATKGVFSVCLPPQGGALVVGTGVYLLVLSPASGSDGKAPASGLDCCEAICNTRYVVEGVQFRLVQVPLALNEFQLGNRLRNHTAYRFFGNEDPGYRRAFADPFGSGTREYGMLATLRQQKCVTDCDVPLAILMWSAAKGLEFIDRWSVRRRLTHPTAIDSWGSWIGDRRVSEAEAMFLQFQEHAADLIRTSATTPVLVDDHFTALPPLGVLPIRTPAVSTGFDLETFFGSHASQDVALIDGRQLRALAHDALDHEPMKVTDTGRIQLYLLWENIRDQEQGSATQMSAVFASPALPYSGRPRFGKGIRTGRSFGRFGLSRFAPRVI